MMLTPAAGSTLASADCPQHLKSTFTFNEKSLAGKFCDFGTHNVSTDFDTAVIFPDGTIGHFISQFNAADGQAKRAGLSWHVRNADGEFVAVQDGVPGEPREPRAGSCGRECRE
jgi:hypothetical protein